MTILITGGAGFIGSHLGVYFTSRGQRVAVLDNFFSGARTNIQHPALTDIVEGDVADAALVAKLTAEATSVFHLAAIASVQVCTAQPALATRTNVAGTQAVFDAVAAAQQATGRVIPVVYASSAAIYGDNAHLPLSETETPTPISLYGEHKLANERIAARAAEQGVRSVGLRFFNVYGARQDPSSPYSGVISKFVERAQAGQPFTVFGDGEQSRDFVYVGDIVAALVAASFYAKGADLFNVCTGQASTLKQLAATIVSLTGSTSAIEHAPARAGDIRHSRGDARAVMAALGITQWVPLDKGLKDMLHV